MSKQAIDLAHEEYLDAMRANSASALAHVLTDDVTFCPPHEPTKKGKAAVRDWFDNITKQVTTESVNISDREVIIAEGWAIEKANFVWAIKPIGGTEVIEDEGRFLAIWRQQNDGSWKAAFNIWNSIKPQ